MASRSLVSPRYKGELAKKVFTNLIGSWVIAREGHEIESAGGKAVFSKIKENCLQYREDLEVQVAESSYTQSISKSLRDTMAVKSKEPEAELRKLTNQEFERRRVYQAHKEYLYKYDESQEKIYVTFNDNRFFHDLVFVNGQATSAVGEHLCSKDTYKAVYDFIDSNFFIISYKITGPEKDYTLKTYFVRSK